MNLDIYLQPKQIELWNLWNHSPFTRIGFGGARGGAKSGGGRRCILLRRLQYPRTTGLLLRRSIKELEQSHLLKIFEEFPDLRQYYREQKKQLILPNGSIQFFGSAPGEKDMKDFYSAEFADILVDEGQEFTQQEIEQLSGSLRCTSNLDIVPKMVVGFMPGISESGLPPRGLSFLKRVCVDKELRGPELKQPWAFLQAFCWDNIEWARKELLRDGIGEGTHDDQDHECPCLECTFYSWPEEVRQEYFIGRTEYGSNLAALTNEGLRDAWLFGKWDTFQGQYFPNFSREKHVITRAHALDTIKPWYTRWLSCDWGFDHPFCVHLHAMDEEGRVITYAEEWGRGMGEEDFGAMIGKLCAGHKFSAFPFSWEAFGKVNKRTRKTITVMISEAMPDGLPKPIAIDASPGSRVSGWRLMYQMLDNGMWQISEDCEKLLECIPSLIRDRDNTEDVLKVDYSENYIGDDPADCARYGLQYMRGASIKPFGVRAQEELAKLPMEGSARYIRHMQLKKQEKTENPGVFYVGRKRR